ncbi:oligosaccharide flippase family protein [Sulfitobacter aestuarii]|uniref:Oligosaccharide flippase family protein n=1 Tax=Sulfitobacter aestuarii TaxID=2161676 RepID=A0ABW5U2K8_9RHOB
MSPYLWSSLLQYSRAGIGALVFLLAARFLSLAEIGIFATAYAPIRLSQALHRAGIAEMVVIRRASERRLNALFWLSVNSGALLSLALALIALALGNRALLILSLLPLLQGLGAVSDGLLRKHLALRALALRSLSVQGIAAAACLAALAAGWGSGALILFVTCNTALGTLLSLHQARWRPTGPPRLREQLLTSRKTAEIATRDLLASGLLPLAQIAIGLSLGLAAAGAFQIATRLVAMLETLGIAPLRYLALPQFAAPGATRPAQQARLAHSLRLSSRITGWLWFLAPDLLPRLIPDQADAVLPVFVALLPLVPIAALAMPFSQALTARGATAPVLARALLCLGLSVLFCAPALALSAPLTAAALSAAALLALVWFLNRARILLCLPGALFWIPLPPLLSGAGMAVILLCLRLGPLPDLVLGSLLYALLLSGCSLPPAREPAA